MIDQRTIRVMVIAGTDRITSTIMKKRKERQLRGKSGAQKSLTFATKRKDRADGDQISESFETRHLMF